MCHQLQNELDDFRRRDGDDHDEPATPVRRVEENEYFGAWRNLGVRKVWINTGEKPAVYGLKRPEMQPLLADVALASDEMTLQLNTFTGFRVATYMAEGDNYRLARTCFSRSRWRFWRKPCWRSWGMASHRRTASAGSACWRTVSERASPLFGFTAASTGGKPACRRTKPCCLR